MLLLNTYQTPVKATIKFLSLLKVKVNASTINNTLQNHPDWPSLLCISDALNSWNVPNAAGKIAFEDIEQIPVPFMAYMHNPEHPIALVTTVSDNSVVAFQHNFNKPSIFKRETFFEQWRGVYLIAEPNDDAGEKNYTQQKWKKIIAGILPIALLGLLMFFAIQKLHFSIAKNEIINNSFAIWMQFAILGCGVFVSASLLWYEQDKNNPLLRQVCTGIAKGDCNAILTGAQSKVFSWLSWSEVGFIYFTGGLLTLLLAKPIASTVQLLGWFHLLALPYTVFSIYYQWRVAKQWCALCLIVQALLVAGAINFTANSFQLSFNFLNLNILSSIAVLYAMPTLLWYSLKPYLIKFQQAKTTKRQYLRVKFNTEIFETLLKNQKTVKLPTWKIGIQLGNPDAKHTLIKVCNPYCGPCSKAHPKIEELLHALPNLKATIIFTAPNNIDNFAYHPVNHFLAIQENNNPKYLIKQALDDWYLSADKDYDVFAAKYPLNGELAKQGDKIELMDKWCINSNIRATPTIFVTVPKIDDHNPTILYQLPDAYNIEDLKYFLQD